MAEAPPRPAPPPPPPPRSRGLVLPHPTAHPAPGRRLLTHEGAVPALLRSWGPGARGQEGHFLAPRSLGQCGPTQHRQTVRFKAQLLGPRVSTGGVAGGGPVGTKKRRGHSTRLSALALPRPVHVPPPHAQVPTSHWQSSGGLRWSPLPTGRCARAITSGRVSPLLAPPPPLCLACFDSTLSSFHSRSVCPHPRSSRPLLLPMPEKREHTLTCFSPNGPSSLGFPGIVSTWGPSTHPEAPLPANAAAGARTPTCGRPGGCAGREGPTPASVASWTSAAVAGQCGGLSWQTWAVWGLLFRACRQVSLCPQRPGQLAARAGHWYRLITAQKANQHRSVL